MGVDRNANGNSSAVAMTAGGNKQATAINANNTNGSSSSSSSNNNNNNNFQHPNGKATNKSDEDAILDNDDPSNKNNSHGKSSSNNNNNNNNINNNDDDDNNGNCSTPPTGPESLVASEEDVADLNRAGSTPGEEQPEQAADPERAKPPNSGHLTSKAKHLRLNMAKAIQQQLEQAQQQRRQQNAAAKRGHHHHHHHHHHDHIQLNNNNNNNHNIHHHHHPHNNHHHRNHFHPLSNHEYLAQLLKDKKQLLSYPSQFLHVNRILDNEINKVRINVLHQNPEETNLVLPDPEGETVVLTKKLFVPQKDYPDFNFVGRILGPRGMTAKQLEQDTGCKIMIRGKGSMRDKTKEEAFRGKPNWEHLDEDLHVLISVEDTENRATLKMARAVKDVEKLLVPSAEGEDSLKKLQLMELAIINGTYRDLGRHHIQGQMAQFLPISTTVSGLGSPQVCMAGPTLIGQPSGQAPLTPTLVTTPVLLTPRIAPYFPPPGTLTRASMMNPGQQNYSVELQPYDGQQQQQQQQPQVNSGLVFQIDPNYVAVHHSPFLEFALFGSTNHGSQPSARQVVPPQEREERVPN